MEVRTVKPGTYKHTITGLTPNTVYKVTVRAKNIKASPFVDEKSLVRLLEKLSAHTEFRTLNKGKLVFLFKNGSRIYSRFHTYENLEFYFQKFVIQKCAPYPQRGHHFS